MKSLAMPSLQTTPRSAAPRGMAHDYPRDWLTDAVDVLLAAALLTVVTLVGLL